MKALLKLVASRLGPWRLAVNTILGVLSGISSFLFIHAVNDTLSFLIAEDYEFLWKYTFYFAAIIAVFVLTRRALSLAIIKLSQSLFWDLRKEVIGSMLNANYTGISSNKTDVNSAIINDVNSLTQASWYAVDFFTSIILAVSCMMYLASISLTLFLITLVTVFAGITVYSLNAKRNVSNFKVALDLENKFVENFDAILHGFKEIFLNPRKGRAIYEQNIVPVANESYFKNTTAHTGMLNNQITGQILFYMLIASVLLFFSSYLGISANDTMGFVFTLLYLLGAIVAIMSLLSVFMKAKVAYNHLMTLKNLLDESKSQNLLPKNLLNKDDFCKIEITNLAFGYENSTQAFSIGPISLSVEKGDVVFIYGGNGSGKTTFIHCLLGLFKPSAGEIKLNGGLVDEENYPDYKAGFSVVFTDFYLFNELFGIENLDERKWNYYLTLFELQDKITLSGKRFSTTHLSTGQRKRLALITALLEEKPMLVLDEWAADQDPYFRKKFYTEIIPSLKRDGFTIIAITHDDRYYHLSDKLYRMDEGKLIEEDVRLYETSNFHF